MLKLRIFSDEQDKMNLSLTDPKKKVLEKKILMSLKLKKSVKKILLEGQ